MTNTRPSGRLTSAHRESCSPAARLYGAVGWLSLPIGVLLNAVVRRSAVFKYRDRRARRTAGYGSHR